MKLTLALLLAALVVVAGCGSQTEPMHVAHSDVRLKVLLHERGVVLGKSLHLSPTALRDAFAAFKEFAETPVAGNELAHDSMADGLLYEFGVFDFHDTWGKTLSLSFVRQYATPDGDIQQAHLEVYFPASAYNSVLRNTHAHVCGGDDCAFRCQFGESGPILGTPCTLDGTAPGRRQLVSASLWSFNSGRTDWAGLVASSPPFEYLAAHGHPLGFDVWQESAE